MDAVGVIEGTRIVEAVVSIAAPATLTNAAAVLAGCSMAVPPGPTTTA